MEYLRTAGWAVSLKNHQLALARMVICIPGLLQCRQKPAKGLGLRVKLWGLLGAIELTYNNDFI